MSACKHRRHSSSLIKGTARQCAIDHASGPSRRRQCLDEEERRWPVLWTWGGRRHAARTPSRSPPGGRGTMALVTCCGSRASKGETQASVWTRRVGGEVSQGTGVVSCDPGDESHYDSGDNGKSISLWVERRVGTAKDWSLCSPDMGVDCRGKTCRGPRVGWPCRAV